ncbi:MAG: hypothetical protein JXA03_04040 [Bacteroidales bacterium]|nr:hypothetical protein [Bacteroidales bacterium]
MQYNPVSGQEEASEGEGTDTTSVVIKHSPHKATLYSLIIPGLGQAYNRKYWKIPVIYAGFGTLYYFVNNNNKEYSKFKEAYNHSLIDGDTLPPVNAYEEQYDSESLLSLKNFYRRNRDFTYILSGFWYLLNVVDAAVDAHLFTWEIDDDITLRVEPELYHYSSSGPYSCLRFRLTF